MISTIELIQQRILHHEELNELKMMNDSDVIQEFDKFMSAFSNEKNAIDRKIVNSLGSSNDESDNIIEIDDNDKKMKFSKRNDNADMIENENEYKNKYKKKYEKKEEWWDNSDLRLTVVNEQAWIFFNQLHYSVALSDTQMNISSTSLHVLTSRVENSSQYSISTL